MKTNIRAEVIRNESFDPYFVVKVSYNDGINKFFDEVVSVERKPPKVTVKYPESIKKIIDKIDVKKIEIEIMKAIVESLLSSNR
ncbi:MAG TPA: hypothetical protein GXZ22_03965 [Clostridiaceae bacterium]|nr:hypothetical protein [Clostridiaceae bacterium]